MSAVNLSDAGFNDIDSRPVIVGSGSSVEDQQRGSHMGVARRAVDVDGLRQEMLYRMHGDVINMTERVQTLSESFARLRTETSRQVLEVHLEQAELAKKTQDKIQALEEKVVQLMRSQEAQRTTPNLEHRVQELQQRVLVLERRFQQRAPLPPAVASAVAGSAGFSGSRPPQKKR